MAVPTAMHSSEWVVLSTVESEQSPGQFTVIVTVICSCDAVYVVEQSE